MLGAPSVAGYSVYIAICLSILNLIKLINPVSLGQADCVFWLDIGREKTTCHHFWSSYEFLLKKGDNSRNYAVDFAAIFSLPLS